VHRPVRRSGARFVLVFSILVPQTVVMPSTSSRPDPSAIRIPNRSSRPRSVSMITRCMERVIFASFEGSTPSRKELAASVPPSRSVALSPVDSLTAGHRASNRRVSASPRPRVVRGQGPRVAVSPRRSKAGSTGPGITVPGLRRWRVRLSGWSGAGAAFCVSTGSSAEREEVPHYPKVGRTIRRLVRKKLYPTC
jgi:hypothetical protein